MKLKQTILILFIALITILSTIAVLAYLALQSTNKSVFLLSKPESLDELLSEWASLPDIPGVIFYVQQGDDVVYSGASGTLQKNKGPMVTALTPFHTASVGKLFTAVTVLKLYERGLLDIDLPVADFIDSDILSGLVVVNDFDYGEQFTVRQLLSHRAGLGNTDRDPSFNINVLTSPNRTWTPRELLSQTRNVPSVGPPGEQTSYSSPGYFLLGLVIEAVTDLPYHQVVRQEIFMPLNMELTFHTLHEWSGEIETLHHYSGWFDLTNYNPSFEFADGGFVTTAQDLARFGIGLSRGELFSRLETFHLFLSNQETLTGKERFRALGPQVEYTESGTLLFFHLGSWGVRFIVSPVEEAVAVIALGQSNAETHLFWADAREFIDNLF